VKKASARKQFKRLISQQSLNEQELAQLRRNLEPRTARLHAWWPRLTLALAATLVVAVGVQLWPARDAGLAQDAAMEQARDIAYSISQEVLTNHLLIRQLELQAGTIEALAEQFAQLDFRILPSRHLADDGLYLVGGRYCTLQGKIATHLVFEAVEGYAVSHYQTAYDRSRFGDVPDIEDAQTPWRVDDRGYQVEIWQEQGLVMAKARPLRVY